MLKHILLTLTALLLLSSVHCDDTSVWISQSLCTLSFQAENNVFSFIDCSARRFYSTSWYSCYSRCCSSFPQVAPSYEAVALCAHLDSTSTASTTSSTSGSINSLVIVLPVVGTVLLVVVISCLYRRCRNRKQQENQEKQAMWNGETEINTKLDIVWSSKADPSRKMERKEQPCAVCLDNSTFAELPCGHRFHPHCIGNWVRKSSSCPCCRQDMQTAKIYCKQCKWRYYISDRMLLAREGKNLPIRCRQCSDRVVEVSGSVEQINGESVNAEVIQICSKE